MIPIAVIAHPARQRQVEKLVAQVQAELISWDQTTLGCAGNHLQAWEYLKTSPSAWVVVLEDDAVPHVDFCRQLPEVLRRAPTPLVSFYLGRGRPDAWQIPISSVIATEACFITTTTLLHTVGYAVRTELIPSMSQAVRRSLNSKKVELPRAMSLWAQRRGHRIGYSHPSLVNHRDEGTLGGHPDREQRTELRKAWVFGSRQRWDASTVEMEPPLLRRRNGEVVLIHH